jgi:hypothetical protein
MQHDDMVAQARMLQAYFKDVLAYDFVSTLQVWCNSNNEVGLTVTVSDTAQEKLPYQAHYKSGYLDESAGSIEELWDLVHAWPGKEERELTALLAATANVVECQQDLRSAQARAYAERITVMHRENGNILRHIRAE